MSKVRVREVRERECVGVIGGEKREGAARVLEDGEGGGIKEDRGRREGERGREELSGRRRERGERERGKRRGLHVCE